MIEKELMSCWYRSTGEDTDPASHCFLQHGDVDGDPSGGRGAAWPLCDAHGEPGPNRTGRDQTRTSDFLGMIRATWGLFQNHTDVRGR